MTFEHEERFHPDDIGSLIDLHVEIARYLPIKNKVHGAKILDLGCGNGYSSKLLLSWGASSVVGIDSSPDAIEYAKKNIARLEGRGPEYCFIALAS
jgi:predicted RNA methylase